MSRFILKDADFFKMSKDEYEKYIKNLVNKSFIEIKRIMCVYYSPIYIKFEEEEVIKTLYANCNEGRLEWSKEALYNDLYTIMQDISDVSKFTKVEFEQLIRIVLAHEIAHLIDKHYKEFCNIEYQTMMSLISLYGKTNIEEQCEELVSRFKEAQIKNQNEAWELARKYILNSKTNYINMKLFNKVKEVCIKRYEILSWEQVYEMEFDVAKNILENKYSKKTINIIMRDIKNQKNYDAKFADEKSNINGGLKNIISNSFRNVFLPFNLIKK